jgi:Flp pilus assembly pilin Flp
LRLDSGCLAAAFVNQSAFIEQENPMTVEEKVEALKASVQDLANRAASDNDLAERLLANPNEVVAETTGVAIPAGVAVTAARREDGAIEISTAADPHFEGELDDDALENVAGGATAVEYGLIAALIGVAIISGVSTLGGKLTKTFGTVERKLA